MAEREKLTIPGEPRLSHRIREAAGRDALGVLRQKVRREAVVV